MEYVASTVASWVFPALWGLVAFFAVARMVEARLSGWAQVGAAAIAGAGACLAVRAIF